MELIRQSVDVWGLCPTGEIESIKRLEKCGRICYKSESKITDTSCFSFIQNIINSGHTSVLEHSNLVIKGDEKDLLFLFGDKKYFRVKGRYVSANLRAWLEYFNVNSIPSIYQRVLAFGSIIEGVPDSLKRITVKFTTSRAITHQLVRHRVMSFLQESQRYVRYSGNIRFIVPIWLECLPDQEGMIFKASCSESEDYYNALLSCGKTPQQARTVLPNATASDILVTGYLDDWKKMIKLRGAKGADPEMINLISMVKL